MTPNHRRRAMQFLVKVLVSSLLIATVSELAKRCTLAAAILASLPTTSILAILWLYREVRDPQKVVDLSLGIFWAVLPSLIFFLILPLALKWGLRFGTAMLLSCGIMILSYALYVALLNKFGVKI